MNLYPDAELKDGAPELYRQYWRQPEEFIEALVRQVEMDFENLDEPNREEVRAIARDICVNGYWRFMAGLPFLVECCKRRFRTKRLMTQ